MEWIKIEDKKPKVNEYVLCQRTNTGMSGTHYILPSIGKMNEYGRFNCAFDWVRVTHWMPLPDPPSEKD